MSATDTAARLEETVREWREILLSLDEPTVRFRPSPERWSIAEVIGHLVDSASNNHQRFVRARDAGALIFPAYEQRAWVSAGNYQDSHWPTLVEFWSLYNLQLAHTVRNIPASKLDTLCTIGSDEPRTLEFLVTDYLDHLNHHLRKIRERSRDLS